MPTKLKRYYVRIGISESQRPHTQNRRMGHPLLKLQERARKASAKELEEIKGRANELVRRYSELTAPPKP